MPKVNRYKELDALRGIASLFVVFFHFTMYRKEADLGFKLGVTGVDLFFIISGFVIYMSILKVSTPLEFMVNRVSRLYPTYWVCVTFTFLLRFFAFRYSFNLSEVSVWQYLANMTMFQYYMKVEDIDGPYWTMIVEMLFYIFIAIIFARKKLNYVIPICFIVLAICLFNDLVVQPFYPIAGKIHKLLPLITHFPLFFAGIVFYKLLHDENSNSRKIIYYLTLTVCFVIKLMFFDNGGPCHSYISFGLYVIPLVSYFILFFLFVNNKLGFIINKVTLFFGKISFALYLIHQCVSINFIIPGLMKTVNCDFWIASFVSLVVVILLASVITYCIEVPASRKMKNTLQIILGSPVKSTLQ